MEDLSDVARVHFGLRIKEFNVVDIKDWSIIKERIKENELEKKIGDVYQKLQIKPKTEEELEGRLRSLATYLANRNQSNTKQEINKRIRLVNWFYHLFSKANIEKYQFTKKYDHYLFDDFPKDAIRRTSIYDASNKNIKLLKVYKIKDVEDNIHFFIQHENKFQEYNILEIETNTADETWLLKHPNQKEYFFGIETSNIQKIKK